MCKREWQFGDWAETEDGARTRVRVIGVFGDFVKGINSEGGIHVIHESKSPTHLPDCDSWTWQPPAAIDPGNQMKHGPAV